MLCPRIPAWFPRTRGDGPRNRRPSTSLARVSPHTRGWTATRRGLEVGRGGFPAHAGMDPRAPARPRSDPRFPRTRGDGPVNLGHVIDMVWVSPHTRGWTRIQRLAGRDDCGFPAHAGMDRFMARGPARRQWFPRTRGDGPMSAAMSRRRSSVSPHTRGWTRLGQPVDRRTDGFPAHAGMDPRSTSSAAWSSGFPRTRGDGPVLERLPRLERMVSPHTRGWTSEEHQHPGAETGFPAHAGMDRGEAGACSAGQGFPRTRGDGPVGDGLLAICMPVSPHTRGWTLVAVGHGRDVGGFPAHAGMDPSASAWATSRTRFPRTRGDGPLYIHVEQLADEVSPHTRGWTGACSCSRWPGEGFPAHAGMDPQARMAPTAGMGFPRTRGDGPP